MVKFENTSGAILSRNKKSKVMGIGRWKGKQDWRERVKYMTVVTEMKFVGFTIYSTYPQTLRGFEKVLFSWQSRQLDTLGCQDLCPQQAVLRGTGPAPPY